ncbi:hypothetical protein BCR39DRAFT_541393, partial [Naematelia encephala]
MEPMDIDLPLEEIIRIQKENSRVSGEGMSMSMSKKKAGNQVSLVNQSTHNEFNKKKTKENKNKNKDKNEDSGDTSRSMKRRRRRQRSTARMLRRQEGMGHLTPRHTTLHQGERPPCRRITISPLPTVTVEQIREFLQAQIGPVEAIRLWKDVADIVFVRRDGWKAYDRYNGWILDGCHQLQVRPYPEV